MSYDKNTIPSLLKASKDKKRGIYITGSSVGFNFPQDKKRLEELNTEIKDILKKVKLVKKPN